MFQIKTARSLTVDKAMFSVVVFFVKLSGKPKKITTAKRARLDEKATILLRWRRYLALSSLSSWDGWQQVGVWCGVWQDYHKHAARPPIGFQPIKPSFFSSSTIFPFLLPTARSICLLFSSLAFNRSEMIWAQMLDKWSDYRKIEARTVYIALFPIHRIQISATYKKTLEMCLSFQNKKQKQVNADCWLIQK